MKVDVPDGHKHCRGCDQTKPHSEWNRNRASTRRVVVVLQTLLVLIGDRISYFSRTVRTVAQAAFGIFVELQARSARSA